LSGERSGVMGYSSFAPVIDAERHASSTQTERYVVASRPKSVPEIVQDLWDLLVAYARQETVEPLRNIGRYLAYGVGGMLVLTLGVFLLGLSGLRALQTETGDVFAGFWSWVPYLIVTIFFGGLVALSLSRISKGGVGEPDPRPANGDVR
jgi:hypothetical protein